jgi:hypothetical protein
MCNEKIIDFEPCKKSDKLLGDLGKQPKRWEFLVNIMTVINLFRKEKRHEEVDDIARDSVDNAVDRANKL